MRILIAEDMEELLEILEIIVQEEYPLAEISLAQNGDIAIQKLKSEGPFDMVLSDYNMPKKNGGQVYLALREISQKTPFILISSDLISDKSEFKSAVSISQITKPFTDKTIIDGLRKAAPKPAELQGPPPPPPYSPTSIPILSKIGVLPVSIYVKLSSDKYIKVHHQGSTITSDDLEKYYKKNIHHLWVETQQFELLFHDYKKKVLSETALKELDNVKAANAIAADHSMLATYGTKYGWSPEVVNITMGVVNNAIKLIERNPDLKSLIEEFTKNKGSRVSTHALLLAVYCTAILKELNWESHLAKEKLTFASLLHDINLNDEIFTTMQTLIINGELDALMQAPINEFKLIHDHPLFIAELLGNWQLCPPDVDVIIRQHHETPDGKGFPSKMKSLQLSPLTCIFILAENVLFHGDNGLSPKEYLISKKEYFNTGSFKQIYQAALNVLDKNEK